MTFAFTDFFLLMMKSDHILSKSCCPAFTKCCFCFFFHIFLRLSPAHFSEAFAFPFSWGFLLPIFLRLSPSHFFWGFLLPHFPEDFSFTFSLGFLLHFPEIFSFHIFVKFHHILMWPLHIFIKLQSLSHVSMSGLFVFFKIIMHQLVKLTYAIQLLQLAISSPLIHALGDPSQAPTGIRTRVPRLRGGRLTNWVIPSTFS